MGFKRAEAVNALAAFQDDVKKAVASLLGEEVLDSQEEVQASSYTKKGRPKAGKISKGGRRGINYVNQVENKDLDEPEEEEEEDPIEALGKRRNNYFHERSHSHD
jgi:hypothetical protein